MQDRYQIDKILGSPVFADLTENALKIRRNLLVTSVIALYVHYASIEIVENSSFLGLQFRGLTNDKIEVAILILLIYFICHFIWYVWDSFLEWRLRITGMSKYQLSLDEGADIGDQIRNSTLYNWWRIQSSDLRETKLDVENISTSVNELKSLVDLDKEKWEPYHINSHLNDLLLKLQSIQQYVKRIVTVMENERFQYSLERFDDWFHHFLASQNLRWLIFEVSLPLILGLWAVATILVPHFKAC